MSEQSNEKARLSGWARLWIVFAAISWVLGGLDIAFTIETFRWPFPLSDLAPQTVRHLIWFVGPVLIAIAWISIRWVWLGFRPSADQAGSPNMSTTEILKIAFQVAQAVIGITIGLIAIVLVAIFGFVTTEGMEASEMSDTWWGGILVTFHMMFMCFIIWSIWEWITGSESN